MPLQVKVLLYQEFFIIKFNLYQKNMYNLKIYLVLVEL